jgi:hypothetical protein
MPMANLNGKCGKNQCFTAFSAVFTLVFAELGQGQKSSRVSSGLENAPGANELSIAVLAPNSVGFSLGAQ